MNTQDIESIIVNYFGSLFSSTCDDIINLIRTSVSATMRDRLDRSYSKEEVEVALNQMKPGKAPGPDGMNPFFYQHYYGTVGDDVSAAVLAILNGSPIPDDLNHTCVSLIPKKRKLVDSSDFRPISLCNVLYKLMTKVITNRDPAQYYFK